MDNTPFFVSAYPSRPRSPWKLEVRASFAGKKIRRFFGSEIAAWEAGEKLTGQIRERGTRSLEVEGMTVAAAVRMFQAGRNDSGYHLEHMTRYLRLFVEKHGRLGISSVGPMELEGFWARPEWPEGRTCRRQAFSCLRTFFNWAERFDIIGRNPIRMVTRPKAPAPLRNIHAPREMAALLERADDEQRAWLCLGGFAGLRSEEIVALDPGALDWKSREIHVDDGKTGERYVKMQGPFVRHCPKSWQAAAKRRAWYKRIEGLGLTRNVLRHSFATYHYARGKDAGKTAFELGHADAKMVTRVYALPAKRADHSAWWRI